MRRKSHFDFAWEWPTGAKKGWDSKAIHKLLSKLRQLNRPVYWCRFHGCAYGLKYRDVPVLKGWTVLTSNRHLWLSLQRKCPGHEHHCECRGEAAKASSYYPAQMVEAIVKAISLGWKTRVADQGISLEKDVEHYLLGLTERAHPQLPNEEIYFKDQQTLCESRDEDLDGFPQVNALTRNSFPLEPPTGRKLELIKQQMLRIHRSSGHASFANLQRLLRARKAPAWSIELAGKLQCPSCLESQKTSSTSTSLPVRGSSAVWNCRHRPL